MPQAIPALRTWFRGQGLPEIAVRVISWRFAKRAFEDVTFLKGQGVDLSKDWPLLLLPRSYIRKIFSVSVDKRPTARQIPVIRFLTENKFPEYYLRLALAGNFNAAQLRDRYNSLRQTVLSLQVLRPLIFMRSQAANKRVKALQEASDEVTAHQWLKKNLPKLQWGMSFEQLIAHMRKHKVNATRLVARVKDWLLKRRTMGGRLPSFWQLRLFGEDRLRARINAPWPSHQAKADFFAKLKEGGIEIREDIQARIMNSNITVAYLREFVSYFTEDPATKLDPDVYGVERVPVTIWQNLIMAQKLYFIKTSVIGRLKAELREEHAKKVLREKYDIDWQQECGMRRRQGLQIYSATVAFRNALVCERNGIKPAPWLLSHTPVHLVKILKARVDEPVLEVPRKFGVQHTRQKYLKPV